MRYRRDGVSIDALAPEGLGPRTNLTTTPPGRTLQLPGGTQALTRTELLPIHTTTSRGHAPRPALLGAIVAKALAVDVDDTPDAQRLDLAFLLSLVEEPLDLATQMAPKDRRRLRARSELADPQHPPGSSSHRTNATEREPRSQSSSDDNAGKTSRVCEPARMTIGSQSLRSRSACGPRG
jgi:hypothetical protein